MLKKKKNKKKMTLYPEDLPIIHIVKTENI